MLKALRWVLFAVVVYFFVLPLLPAFRGAVADLRQIDPVLLAAAIGLEFVALYCYTLLTHAALGPDANRLTRFDLFRIQLSTRALGSILPAGSAASNALGFRLITSSGVKKADAGFALATAGIGSAVILNVLLWVGLVVSIPLRGSSPVYSTAAVAGAVLMGIVGAIVFGLVDDKGRLARVVRYVYDRLGRDGESAAELLDHLRDRIRGLVAERDVLRRVILWGTANWLLDLLALWLFLRAFGGSVSVDGLLVAFGLANVLASIPITPAVSASSRAFTFRHSSASAFRLRRRRSRCSRIASRSSGCRFSSVEWRMRRCAPARWRPCPHRSRGSVACSRRRAPARRCARPRRTGSRPTRRATARASSPRRAMRTPANSLRRTRASSPSSPVPNEPPRLAHVLLKP